LAVEFCLQQIEHGVWPRQAADMRRLDAVGVLLNVMGAPPVWPRILAEETMMERTSPPFRADHVGSLIRPKSLIDARRKHNEGKLAADDLRQLEDRAIREVVALQEEIGLHAITDGEFRRQSYLTEFLCPLGVEFLQGKSPDMVYHGEDGRTAPGTLAVVNRKIAWTGSPNVVSFIYLKSITRQTPKVTLPAPTQVHQFAGKDGISRSVYPISPSSGRHGRGLPCRARRLGRGRLPLCADRRDQHAQARRSRDPGVVRRRGEDWRAVLETYAEVMNRIIRGAPDGMIVAVHHCRGNNAGAGWRRPATTRSPSCCSARSRPSPTFSNTTRRVPGISRRCASCEGQGRDPRPRLDQEQSRRDRR